MCLLKPTAFWRLPDFNCETVQATLQKPNASGEWRTFSGSHLIKFAEIDPAPELFSGFASHKEMPPSELMKSYM